MIAEHLLVWLGLYLMHSTVFLALAWLLARRPLVRSLALQETLWKGALLAGFFTATLHVAGVAPAFGTRIEPSALVGPKLSLATTPAVHQAADAVSQPAALPHFAVAQNAASAADGWAIPWLGALAATYIFTVLGLLLRVLYLELRFRKHIAGRAMLEAGPLVEALERLKLQAGVSGAIRLSVCDALEGPVAFGNGGRSEICLPPRVASELNARQHEALLAHELAHLVRQDSFWLRTMAVASSVGFMQPLNRLATQRLMGLGEMRCDDWALRQRADGRALASCLTAVAGWMTTCPRTTPGAAWMAGLRSPLGRRVERALDPDVQRREPGGVLRWTFALVGVLAVSAVLPNFGWSDEGAVGAALRLAQAQSDSKLARPNDLAGKEADSRQYRDGWQSLLSSVDIRAFGTVGVRFDEEGKVALVSLDDDGSLTLSERKGFVIREMTVRASDAGELSFEFTKNGSTHEIDGDVEAWFDDVLNKAVLHGPFAVESIYSSLYASGGADAVLAHVAGMAQAWPQAVYFQLLLQEPALNIDQAEAVFRSAADTLARDAWALETFLSESMPLVKANPALDGAYGLAVAELDEAWQRDALLSAMVAEGFVRAGLLPPMLQGLEEVEKATLLLTAAPSWMQDAELAEEFLRVTRNVLNEDSRGSLLIVAARNSADSDPALHGEVIARVLAETGELESAAKRADVLKWTGKLAPAGMADAYLDAVEAQTSGRHQRDALTWFLERDDLPATVMARGNDLG